MSPQHVSVAARTTVDRPRAAVRCLAAFGAASVMCCATSLGLLHVLPPGRGLSPVSAPISDYARTSAAWLFDMSVVILAAGVAALLAAFVLSGCITPRSAPFRVMLACCAALVVVVIFPDHGMKGVLEASGWVHWSAAMVAFGGLPVASTMLRRHHRGEGCTRMPGVARGLALTAGGCFVVLFVGSILDLATPLPIWRVGGIVERVLALSEMTVTVLMALWARRGCTCTPVPAPTEISDAALNEGAGKRVDVGIPTLWRCEEPTAGSRY